VAKQRARGNLLLSRVAVVSVAAGICLAAFGQHQHRWSPPPLPPGWAAVPGAAAGYSRVLARPMPRSVPVQVRIPAIGVDAHIISLGLGADDTVAVPPLSEPFLVGWYTGGSSPGQRGPAVLLGHVDSYAVGPAVFYRLGEVRPGDLIYVALADQQTAVFKVASVALYPKQDFPAAQVYGSTRQPALRLVTCGGAFDSYTRHYVGNVVAFAIYLGSGPTVN
jgi:sortase (surface protein transpeptidase)